ncbi:unnamed protein product [Rotaria sp. Silwood1]|nr:unnamed protein product [Rotaria sp. Silwood1]CAF5096416.1 unnamed protein product [Rotaria sp. Silwood1]
MFDKILKHFDGNIAGKTFAIWGLAFKPNTDDMREAPSLVLIESLLQAGAIVKVFDPVAIKEAKHELGEKVIYAKDVYEASADADAIALVTEWNEFRLPDWKRIQASLKQKVVFDGRNLYDDVVMQKAGFIYYGVGLGKKTGVSVIN